MIPAFLKLVFADFSSQGFDNHSLNALDADAKSGAYSEDNLLFSANDTNLSENFKPIADTDDLSYKVEAPITEAPFRYIAQH